MTHSFQNHWALQENSCAALFLRLLLRNLITLTLYQHLPGKASFPHKFALFGQKQWDFQPRKGMQHRKWWENGPAPGNNGAGALLFCRGCPGQHGLRCSLRHAGHSQELLLGGFADGLEAAELRQQGLAPLGADAGDIVQR